MTFFNEDGTVRTDSEDSVLEFLATNVSKKRRAKLLANVLYAKYAIESKDDILISDFFRILEKNGYRLYGGIGGYFRNIAFTYGE